MVGLKIEVKPDSTAGCVFYNVCIRLGTKQSKTCRKKTVCSTREHTNSQRHLKYQSFTVSHTSSVIMLLNYDITNVMWDSNQKSFWNEVLFHISRQHSVQIVSVLSQFCSDFVPFMFLSISCYTHSNRKRKGTTILTQWLWSNNQKTVGILQRYLVKSPILPSVRFSGIYW